MHYTSGHTKSFCASSDGPRSAKISSHRKKINRKIKLLKIQEARNSFFGIGVDLFKSISRMAGLLRFPSYHTTFVTYDHILCFGWFPSNSFYHSNGNAKRFISK